MALYTVSPGKLTATDDPSAVVWRGKRRGDSFHIAHVYLNRKSERIPRPALLAGLRG
jgi:hypothetical protein